MSLSLNNNPELEKLVAVTVDSLLSVHRELGPGLLENVYAHFLETELRARGIACAREVAIPVSYRGSRLDLGFRADLIVRESLLLELKAVETLSPLHRAQTITYLKIAKLPIGLLVNFNVPFIRDGIRRLYNPITP